VKYDRGGGRKVELVQPLGPLMKSLPLNNLTLLLGSLVQRGLSCEFSNVSKIDGDSPEAH